jgi:hypothetical protein
MQDLPKPFDSVRIFSPQPKRLGIRILPIVVRNTLINERDVPIRNVSKSETPEYSEEEEVMQELAELISLKRSFTSPEPVSPISPAPVLKRYMTWGSMKSGTTPPRDKQNPIIFDEFFKELNCSISTAENSPLRSFSPETV